MSRKQTTKVFFKLDGTKPLTGDMAIRVPFTNHEHDIGIIRSIEIDRETSNGGGAVFIKYYRSEFDNGVPKPLDAEDKRHEEILAIFENPDDGLKKLEFVLVADNLAMIRVAGTIAVKIGIVYTDLDESIEPTAEEKRQQNDRAYLKLEYDLRAKNPYESPRINAIWKEVNKIVEPAGRVQVLINYIFEARDIETKELRMVWTGCWIVDQRHVIVNSSRMHDLIKCLMSGVGGYFRSHGYKYSKKMVDRKRLDEILDRYKISKWGWVHYALA